MEPYGTAVSATCKPPCTESLPLANRQLPAASDISSGTLPIRPAPPSSVPDRGVAKLPVRRVSYSTVGARSEEHTTELQSLMRNSYDVLCFKKKQDKVQTT